MFLIHSLVLQWGKTLVEHFVQPTEAFSSFVFKCDFHKTQKKAKNHFDPKTYTLTVLETTECQPKNGEQKPLQHGSMIQLNKSAEF